jgi:hypothetical protein
MCCPFVVQYFASYIITDLIAVLIASWRQVSAKQNRNSRSSLKSFNLFGILSQRISNVYLHFIQIGSYSMTNIFIDPFITLQLNWCSMKKKHINCICFLFIRLPNFIMELQNLFYFHLILALWGVNYDLTFFKSFKYLWPETMKNKCFEFMWGDFTLSFLSF